MQTVQIEVSDDEFAHALADELSTPGVTPLAATSRLFDGALLRSIGDTLGGRLIKHPSTVEGIQWSGWYDTLADLAETGAEVWHPELRFSTRLADAIDEAEVLSTGISLKPMEFASGVMRRFQLKTQRLKTQANHELRLFNVAFPSPLFRKTLELLNSGPGLVQPYIANPQPHGFRHRYANVNGYLTVAFDHVIDGTRLFCSCARKAHYLMRADATAIMTSYLPDSWPHRTVELLKYAVYRDGICHLCVADASGSEAAAQMYGDDIQIFENIYMDQLMREGHDKRTARAEVQRRLGISRWKSEAELYQIVKGMFPEEVVQREASPVWLGRQRLDIYISKLKLAIEYQGAQHFAPVAMFGGDAGLVRARERDALKKRLCAENGVELLYVHHGDPLSSPAIKRRLARFLT